MLVETIDGTPDAIESRTSGVKWGKSGDNYQRITYHYRPSGLLLSGPDRLSGTKHRRKNAPSLLWT